MSVACFDPQTLWVWYLFLLSIRTVYTCELQMFWLNLSILIQIINKICIFKKCTLRNFKLIICMEKRIGVSLSACQALAPHAGQMLLITLVVLAGPVWVSVMREAACNPELCM